MKKSVLVSALSVAALFGVVTPSLASTLTFSTEVNGAQARPNPVDTNAQGEALLVVDTYDRTFDFSLDVVGIDLADLGGLPQNVLDTAGPVHLHLGGPEQTGPIVAAFGPTSGSAFDDAFPVTTAGLGSIPGFSLDVEDFAFELDADFDAFLSNLQSGLIYVNVHTFFSPPGEIRGNFGAGEVSAVPLPASALLLLACLGAFFGIGRCRTKIA